MPRFFIETPLSDTVILSGESAAHISKSLRMKVGETLVLCDGMGYDYISEICSITPDYVNLKVLSKEQTKTEPSVKVTLCQGLPKSDKMESIIQKSVEMGVTTICPVLTERCVSRPDEKGKAKKAARWQKIADEAAKQSGRGILPKVENISDFKATAKALADKGVKLIMCYEGGGENPKSLLAPNDTEIAVFIGPEGGFDTKEVEFLKELGAECMTLGPRILRTETAPIAVLSLIMLLTDNM